MLKSLSPVEAELYIKAIAKEIGISEAPLRSGVFNDDKVKFTVQTASTPILDQFGGTLKDVAEILLYVGIGFAVFAALLLMNFISTSISYKKREIGILRALGARGSDVFGIFFNESSVISIINFTLATIATFVTCGILNNVIITKLIVIAKDDNIKILDLNFIFPPF